MPAQISWDQSGRHVVIVLDHPVPEDDDVEGALCSYCGIERVRLHWDRSVIELVVANPAHHPCAEAAMLHLFAQGYVRPALWFDGEPSFCR